jgi:hypothetical protein
MKVASWLQFGLYILSGSLNQQQKIQIAKGKFDVNSN